MEDTQKIKIEENQIIEKYPDTSTDFSKFLKINSDNDIFENSLKKSKIKIAKVPPRWTENDLKSALILSKSGNVRCLNHLFDMDYNPIFVSKSDGVSLAMVAAEEGQIAVLDFLMNRHIDLTQKDRNMRSVLHYASTCTKESVLMYLLTHENRTICKLDKVELTGQDVDGYTPLHVAAKYLSYGISLSADFFMDSSLNMALELKDNKGLSNIISRMYK